MTQVTFDARHALNRANALYSLGLFKCAKITAEMLLAHLVTQKRADPLLTGAAGAQQKLLEARAFAVFAKALSRTGEPFRAKMYYDRALMTLQYAEVLRSATGGTDTENPPPAEDAPGCPEGTADECDGAVLPSELAETSLLAAEAALKSGLRGAARTALEAIPERSRNVRVLFLLGKICEDSSPSEAKYYYRAVLGQAPDAVYVAKCLLQISSPSDHPAILSYCSAASSWLPLYLNGYSHRISHKYQAAVELYRELQQQLKSCADLQSEICATLYEWGRTQEALLEFDRLRTLDPYVVDQMDRYARLLQEHKQDRLVKYLTEDLMNITDARPEVWVTIARLLQSKAPQRSRIALEKAIKCDPKHVEAYIVKGALVQRTKEALEVWRTAYRLSKEYWVYNGLVEEYLNQGQYAEAMAAAKEAFSILHEDPRVHVLIGKVLVRCAGQTKGTNSLEKARKAFEDALKADRWCVGAIMGLVDLDVKEGKARDAIDRLQEYFDMASSDDEVLCRIADLHFQLGEYNEAFQTYSKALKWNPQSRRAASGILRVENKVSGIEDDEDDEGDDADGEDLNLAEEEELEAEMESMDADILTEDDVS